MHFRCSFAVEEEKSSLFDGQSVLLPCRHILSALPKSLKQASKISSVLYKHSKNMNMKICVNNSLARKYSISKGWVFFCQCSHSCPSGWVAIRCVSPWETWPGEFPGRRAKRGHAAWVSVGRPVVYLTPPNTIFQSTGVGSGFGKQLETMVGFLSCLRTWCNPPLWQESK